MPRSEIIYSAQKTGFIEGHRYANPRLFNRPRAAVTSVIVVGNWPNIVDAYRHGDREVAVAQVEHADDLPAFLASRDSAGANEGANPDLTTNFDRPAELPAAVEHSRTAETRQQQEAVALPPPDEMKTMAWPALRRIAAQVSNDPIHSRSGAEEAIEIERKRRAGA